MQLDDAVLLPNSIDTRLRIIAAVIFSITVVAVSEPLLTALVMALVAAAFMGVPIKALVLRVLPLNLFMLFLFLTLPWSVPGETLLQLGTLKYSIDGFFRTIEIWLKGNIIVIALTALIGTIEPAKLGYALERLYVPQKLTRTLLFTVRYLDIIEQEYSRLRRAMFIRGFQPRLNRHTLRSFAYLVGMLLVHALDRSERILGAMRCRGFDGHFRPMDQPKLTRGDALFGIFVSAAIIILIRIELSPNWTILP